ncbi:MAG TPA: ATP-binding protein, partial [Gemmatimonadaceae bacterium]|nr:ATP-binding protein [Gemmatimonadaceae bacterium]
AARCGSMSKLYLAPVLPRSRSHCRRRPNPAPALVSTPALARSSPPARRQLSLEQRLPLLISTLLSLVVIASLLLTYREVEESAKLAGVERLHRMSRQLAELAATGTQARVAALQKAAAAAPVQTALRSPALPPDSAALAALAVVQVPSDSGLPVVLLTRSGDPVGRVGLEVGTEHVALQARHTTIARADSGGYGRLYTSGGRVYFWVLAPVRVADGRLLGYVAQLRRVGGNPRIEQQLRGLTGQSDMHVYLRNDSGRVWTTLAGAPVPPPVSVDSEGDLVRYRRPGAITIAAASPVSGTPFQMVAETTEASIVARPKDIMRRLGLVSLVLILLGAAASWVLSRRLTRPLVQLTTAAEGIAQGDYDRSVDVNSSDEIGRLATTFNGMAAQVRDTHRELERQNAEARRIATELAYANERLEDAATEALAANRAKSAFLATMSHEIRTPINAMMGYAELLQMGISGRVTDDQRRQLERIRASGHHLLGLVNEVLDFARIESSQLAVTNSESPAAEVVDASMALVRPQAEAKQLTLTLGTNDPAVRYLGDAQRVRQIMVNLLTNAVKFTPAGGRVEVSYGTGRRPGMPADAEDTWTFFRVTDTGIGIRPEELQRIFEPFIQADAGYTRKQGGTGLGLSISRSLAQLMGGDVSVESRPEHGSTFMLWLPAPAVRAVAAAPAVASIPR